VIPTAPGSEEVSLSWTADPDPDVSHLARYSSDGREWIALSNDMRENPVVLDLRGLPTGPACVIEVAASLRGRTSVLRSAPFACDPAAPRAVIALPRPRLAGVPLPIPFSSLVHFSSHRFTADGPPIRDDALTWVLEDARGAAMLLGRGSRLIVAARTHPSGVSTIHLRLAGGTADQIMVRRAGSGGPSPVAGPGGGVAGRALGGVAADR